MKQLNFVQFEWRRWLIIVGKIVMVGLVSISCTAKPKFVTALEECESIQQEDAREACATGILGEAIDAAMRTDTDIDPAVIAKASDVCASIQQEDIRKKCVASIQSIRVAKDWEREPEKFDWGTPPTCTGILVAPLVFLVLLLLRKIK
jgi:hypothetical protein